MINSNVRLAFILLVAVPSADTHTGNPSALVRAVTTGWDGSNLRQQARTTSRSIADKGSPASGANESAGGPTNSLQRRKAVEDSSVPISVSLVALLSRPEPYAGRRVRTQGFLSLEFEGLALHLTEADWDAGVTLNALRLVMSEEDRMRRKDCHLSYVTITATFSPSDKGAHQFYSGALTKVTDIWRNVTHQHPFGELDVKCGGP